MRAYSRAYRVNLDEAADCPDGYCSFDAFFTRRLRDGARSVSSDPVVSPADGVLSAVGSIDPGMRLWVKGRPYEVGDLIADPIFAERYRGGEFAVVYLAPGDYHRVHSPVDGQHRSGSGDRAATCFPSMPSASAMFRAFSWKIAGWRSSSTPADWAR